jgi:CelD/BcsL family acetyltransferase involved in cellulose biosynthesis
MGVKHFDMCVGESDYKKKWADDTVELFHIISARSWRSMPFVVFIRAKQAIRRLIKQSGPLKHTYYWIRRQVGHVN